MVQKLKCLILIFVYLVPFSLIWVFGEDETINLEAMYEIKNYQAPPIIFYENEDEVFFKYKGIAHIDKRKFTHTTVNSNFSRILYCRDEIITVDRSSGSVGKNAVDINLLSGTTVPSKGIGLFAGKIDYKFIQYYQNDVFYHFKLKDGGPDWIDADLYEDDLIRNRSTKLVSGILTGGSMLFSPDKTNLLIDTGYSALLYNNVDKESTKYLEKHDVQITGIFVNSSLIMARKQHSRIWTLVDLNTNDQYTFQIYINGESINSIIFFNHIRNALAGGAKAYVVDARPFRAWLEAKGLVLKPKEVKIRKGAKVYKNGNFRAPLLVQAEKETESLCWDKGSSPVRRDDQKDYFYHVVLPDGSYGWVFGRDLQFGNSADRKKLDSSMDSFVSEKQTEESLSNLYTIKILSIKASSRDSYGSNTNRYHPVHIFDNLPLTDWSEGAESEGVKEYFEVKFDKEIIVDKMIFYLGKYKYPSYYKINRIKELSLITDNRSIKLQFQDIEKAQASELAEPLKFKELKCVIEAVYQTSEIHKTTGLFELEFYYKDKKYNIDLGEYRNLEGLRIK